MPLVNIHSVRDMDGSRTDSAFVAGDVHERARNRTDHADAYAAGEQCGRAEEAANFYTSVFHDAKVATFFATGNEEPDQEGTIKHVGVDAVGAAAVMDSARAHNFTFNEAISFMVHCNTQDEIDYFWGKLSADPKAEACGWLKDKFGLSWQIVPTAMDEMLQDRNETKLARVTEGF
jgi:predicted 3-demethylubiquinone-9 3-methyltransferase (glyoxalase superfamily)